MKLLLILILAFISINGLYAQGTERFELYFSTYNHAEGIVDSYKIANEEIVVSVKGFIDEKDNIIYTARISEDVIEKIKSLKLDALENNYYNNCILITSGTEYFINVMLGNVSKQIHLHDYYQRDVADLIELINISLPKKHHIDYLDQDNEQDCP